MGHTGYICVLPFGKCAGYCAESRAEPRGSGCSRASSSVSLKGRLGPLVVRMLKNWPYIGAVWHLRCKFLEMTWIISCGISLLCFYQNHPSGIKDEICPTVTYVAFRASVVCTQSQSREVGPVFSLFCLHSVLQKAVPPSTWYFLNFGNKTQVLTGRCGPSWLAERSHMQLGVSLNPEARLPPQPLATPLVHSSITRCSLLFWFLLGAGEPWGAGTRCSAYLCSKR